MDTGEPQEGGVPAAQEYFALCSAPVQSPGCRGDGHPRLPPACEGPHFFGDALEEAARFSRLLGWPSLSFAGQVGFGLQVVMPGGTGKDTEVNFFTTVDDVNVVNTGSIGFHFYF